MSCQDSELGKWLQSHGGGFHESLEFRRDDYGLSVYAKVPLPAGASAVTCPFALAITPAVAHQNLQQILSTEDNGLWTDHELMALYLALSYKQSPGITRGHDPYISALPKPKDMRTPVYFTYDERRLLAGTNLEGAVNDRENGWRNEFNGLLNRLAGRPLHSVPTLGEWTWACTILSSRAFPSHLIPSEASRSEPTPVLFPGVDMLNHRLGARASWFTDVHKPPAVKSTETGSAQLDGGLSIILEDGVPAGEQAFNTYGPKPNEELLLGYGFVLEGENPADVVALKIPVPTFGPAKKIWERAGLAQHDGGRVFVGRDGELPRTLIRQARAMFVTDDVGIVNARDEEEACRYLDQTDHELECITFMTILDMLDDKRTKLETLQDVDGTENEGVRPEVRHMVNVYRRGQADVLLAACKWVENQLESVFARAKAEGIDLGSEFYQNEDDDDEDGDRNQVDAKSKER